MYYQFEVKDLTYENPKEIRESDPDIQFGKEYAFNQLGWSYDYIGCGPLAMIGMFDYVQRVKDYSPLMLNFNGADRVSDSSNYLAGEFRRLSANVIETVEVIPFGPLGTATLPGAFTSGANEIIATSNLSQQLNVESKMFISHSTKVAEIKNHIDNGMPVVWWTGPNEGFYKNHYVNIYGYEVWTALDEVGNPVIHTMFILRLNWGRGYNSWAYADEDALKAIGGLIFFTETYQALTIYPETFSTMRQQYFYTVQSSDFLTSHPYKNDILFSTNRLRTGYINTTGITQLGSWYLTMSAKRENAGEAFMEFSFPMPIYGINIDLSLWSSLEGITANNSSVTLEVFNNGQWTTVYEFLSDPTFSKSKMLPSNHTFIFNDEVGIQSVSLFRLRVVAPATGSSSNLGRVVISDMFLLYGI